MNNPLVIKAGHELVPFDKITSMSICNIESEIVIIRTADDVFVAEGFDAIEAVMLLKPSALEGRRLKWHKSAWAAHNLIYHPLMQILVWLGYKKAAIRLHDWSTPRPRQR